MLKLELEQEILESARIKQLETVEKINNRLFKFSSDEKKLQYIIPRCAAFQAQILCLKRDLAKANDLATWQKENLQNVSDFIHESEVSSRQMENELFQVCTGGQIYQEKYDSLIYDLTNMARNQNSVTSQNLQNILAKHGTAIDAIRQTVLQEINTRSTIYQSTFRATMTAKSQPPPPPPPPDSLKNSIKILPKDAIVNSNLELNISMPEPNFISDIQNGKFNLKPIENLDNWKNDKKRAAAKGIVDSLQTTIAAALNQMWINARPNDNDEDDDRDDDDW